MSTVKYIYLVCDEQGPGCHKHFGFDEHYTSSEELHAKAIAAGWRYNKGESSDTCPACQCNFNKGFQKRVVIK